MGAKSAWAPPRYQSGATEFAGVENADASVENEIRRLTLLHRCRKSAIDDDEPLREIKRRHAERPPATARKFLSAPSRVLCRNAAAQIFALIALQSS